MSTTCRPSVASVRFPELPGAALCATGMAILGASVAVSRAILRYPALTGQAFRYAVAAAILALLVRPGAGPRTPTMGEAAALAYLALVLTVGAFLLWYLGLQRLGVARAGLFVGVLPMATVAAATLLDGRLPAPAQTLGVLVVGAGLSLPVVLKDPRRYSASNSSGSPSPSSGSSDRSASARRTASA